VAERVLVTGIGPITAVGIGRGDLTEGLRQGRQGVRPIEGFNPEAYAVREAAECLEFAVEDYLESEKTYLDRCSELALAGCVLALQDAGLRPGTVAPERFGLALGTAYGPLDTMWASTERVQQRGLRAASSTLFPHSFANTPTSLASIEFGIQGPVCTYCSGDTAAAAAIEYAFGMLRTGRADVILAGGAEALSEALFSALDEAGTLANGLVPGEGAGLLVLERESHACGRGAPVLAELMACALATDPEAPDRAAGRAFAQAAREAGLEAVLGAPSRRPGSYGHAFGASAALDACALIAAGLLPAAVVALDASGAAAAIILAPA